MTYEASEISVHDGKPIELFKFEGTYANFYYTSGPKAVVFDGNTYEPVAIKRSEISAGTQEDDGLDMTVEVSASSALAQTYGFSATPPRLKLTVYRFHRGDDADWRRYWIGPVNNIQTSNGRSSLRSPSALASALLGQVPNVYFQAPCNHVLYDARCGVLEALWTVNTTVTAVASKAITVASLVEGSIDLTDKLVGGEISLASGERRMIVSQTGSVVNVNFPFFGLIAGTAVKIVAGCDNAYRGDCKTKFHNQRRFGGQPFIPNDNVFQTNLEPGKPIPDTTCLPPAVIEFTGWYWEFMVRVTVAGYWSETPFAVDCLAFVYGPAIGGVNQFVKVYTLRASDGFPQDTGEYFLRPGPGARSIEFGMRIFGPPPEMDAHGMTTFNQNLPYIMPTQSNDSTMYKQEIFYRHWDSSYIQVYEGDYTTARTSIYVDFEI